MLLKFGEKCMDDRSCLFVTFFVRIIPALMTGACRSSSQGTLGTIGFKRRSLECTKMSDKISLLLYLMIYKHCLASV